MQIALPTFLFACLSSFGQLITSPVQADAVKEEGPSTSPAVRLRNLGYASDELFVKTTTGYVLRLTRGKNPHIEGGSLAGKDPVLFIHGAFAAADVWLLYSEGAKAKDLTRGNSSCQKGLDAMRNELADEPAARSLALLALNCGREIWLLDRRGVPGSQQLIGDPLSVAAEARTDDHIDRDSDLITKGAALFSLVANNLLPFGGSFLKQVAFAADLRFWNFSLDEQALVDFPQTIDFILENSSRNASRVAVVGHSAGAAITLMALASKPEQLARKLSTVILWSPAFSMGSKNPGLGFRLGLVRPLLEAYSGPLPPGFSVYPTQESLMQACGSLATWTTVCEAFTDLQYGPSGGQQPITPRYFSGQYYSSPSHALAQLTQAATAYGPNHTMHSYDYGPARNQIAYGQSVPPAYDLGTLRNFTSLSFYSAANDSVVTPADVEMARSQLRGESPLVFYFSP